MSEPTQIICCKCQKPLEIKRVDFDYLNQFFHTDALRCPECGMVYIPEDLVEGKMAEVETSLEDK